jgi:hypothetical protein
VTSAENRFLLSQLFYLTILLVVEYLAEEDFGCLYPPIRITAPLLLQLSWSPGVDRRGSALLLSFVFPKRSYPL